MTPKTIKNDLSIIKTWAQQNVILSSQETMDVLQWCEQQESILNLALRSPIKIGLIGGTGVGKSTIINKLAEKKISADHNIRPYTNKIIVYQYKDFAPIFDKNDPLTIIHHHDRKEISHLILYDFPDYDSLIPDHRQMVQQYSKELDIIIWVTSPEKYADQSMLSIMPTLLQSSENYCFVLNKIDQLTIEETAQIIGHWNILLGQSKISDAPIFAISAIQSNEIIDNNDFQTLKKWIFKKRKEHEIIQIKQSNIDHQIRQKTQQLRQQISDQKISDIQKKIKKIHSELAVFEKNRKDDILELLTSDAHLSIHQYLSQQSRFLWPVGLAFLFIRRLKQNSGQNRPQKLSPKIPEMFLKSIDRQVNLMCKHTPFQEDQISLSEIFDNFINHYQDAKQIVPYLGKISKTQSFFFLMRQWIAVFVPIIFFFIYLGGGLPSDFLDNPVQITYGVMFLLNIINRFFHIDGLTAMFSLMIIETFICLHIAGTWYNRMSYQTNHLYSNLSNQVSNQLSGSLLNALKPLEDWVDKAQRDYQSLVDLSNEEA